MGIQLKKGQKIDLTKSNPSLNNVLIGLGWDTKSYDGGHEYDLDASVFLLNKEGRCAGDRDFIFYNNTVSLDGSINHLGDNRTGDGDGDDEQVTVKLSLVDTSIDKIVITVTIHDYDVRGQNFGQVENAFVRLVDEDTGQEILRYDLGEDFSIETGVVFCEVYRHGIDWKFNAVGSGYSGGLGALVSRYGLSAE